jgi:DNA-binding transcriptional ArsR family regulator
MTDQLDTIFEAFGHGKRRGIVMTLAYRPATVSQLADEHDLSLPAIHKHIRLLEKAQLIQRKKVGRNSFVAFDRDGMNLAQAWVMQFNTAWGNNQETLDNYIASLQSGHQPHGRNVKTNQ